MTSTLPNQTATHIALHINRGNQKGCYAAIIFLFAALLFTQMLSAQAVNKWVGTSNDNWNNRSNWSQKALPDANDDVVIDKNATINVNTNATINTLTISNNATVAFTAGTSDRSITIDNTGSSISKGASLILTASSGGMTLAFSGNNREMNIAGTLEVGTSAVFNASNSITTVSGTLKNENIVTPGNNLAFAAGGTYEHAINGGTIPNAAWDANATLLITGMTTAYPTSGMNQNFGNVYFNTASSSTLELNSNLTCRGNLTLANSGTGSLALTNGGSSRIITVAGDFTVNSGYFFQTKGSASGQVTVEGNFTKNGLGNYSITASQNAQSFTVKGNVSITAGTVTVAAGSGAGNWYVGGNFSHTGGTITETSSGAGNIIFNGTGNEQVFTSGGTVSNSINYTVNNGAYLQMDATSTIVKGNSFTLSSNASLGIRSAAGVNASGAAGNVQTTIRNFAAGSNFIYNGTANQATGDALTVTNKTNLTIDNPATVTGNATAFSITGHLLVKKGNLLLTATNADYSIAGDLIVQPGATLTHQVSWDASGKKITVAGNIAIDGNYSKGTAPRAHVNMTGSGKKVHSGSSAFNILTLTNAAGTVIAADGNITTNDNFWPQWVSGGTFECVGHKITANAGMLMAGGITNIGEGAVLDISNGVFAGYQTYAATLNMNGGSIISNGSINITDGSNIICSGPNNKLSLTGNFENNGNFTAGSSLVEFNGVGTQMMSLTKPTTFSNLRISNNTTVNASDTVKVTGNIDFGAVNNKIFATNDKLTLVSNAQATASVGDMTNDGQNSGNRITGKVNVERYISNAAKWRLLAISTNTVQSFKQAWQEGAATANANPVANYGMLIGNNNSSTYAANGFDLYTPGGPTVKYYNPGTNAWVGISNTNAAINTAGGYMTYTRSSRSGVLGATTIRTSGELNSGTQPAISVGANQFAVVGNPFASAIDVRKITTQGLQDVYYVWDPKAGGGYGLGAYQTLIRLGNDYSVFPGGGSYGAQLSVVNNIESGLAFFVKAGATGGSIQITESSKVSGSVNVFRTVQTNSPMLRSTLYAVTADSTTLLDAAMVNIDAAFSIAVDDEDLKKMVNGSENVSINNNGVLLLANRRPDFSGNDTVKLNLTGVRLQNYKWNITMNNMEANGRTAFLLDAYNNTSTALDMQGSTEYSFSIINQAASYAANRFSIVFTPAAVLLPVTITTVSASRNSANSSQIAVNWKVENESSLKYYELEYSTDAANFSTVATVAANASSGSAAYSQLHTSASAAVVFYRIKALSFSGQVQYSAVVRVNSSKINSSESISVYPNPVVNKNMNVQFTNQAEGSYTVELISRSGARLLQTSTNVTSNNQVKTLQLAQGTAAGNYTLIVTAQNGTTHSTNVVVL